MLLLSKLEAEECSAAEAEVKSFDALAAAVQALEDYESGPSGASDRDSISQLQDKVCVAANCVVQKKSLTTLRMYSLQSHSQVQISLHLHVKIQNDCILRRCKGTS